MIRAIYPGSFDPVTFGHLDIIKRSASVVDELVIGVLVNSSKDPMFSLEERVEMLKEVTSDLDNVRMVSFEGLLVDFARQEGASVIIRGLRAITDFEYELQMAQTNRILEPTIDTMFLTTGLEFSYISSTIVKEVAQLNGDISHFVPHDVLKRIKEKQPNK